MKEKYPDQYYKRHYSQLLKNKHLILDWQKDMLMFFKKTPTLKNKSIMIVDIGCGVANLTFFMKKFGYKNIFGFDISKNALKKTKKFYKGLPVCLSDSKEISIKNECIDVCFVSQLLEHLSEKESTKTLKEIRRILKPNRLFISSHPISSIFSKFITRSKGDETHVQSFLFSELFKIVENYFEIIDYRLYSLSIRNQFKLLLTDFNFNHFSEFIITILSKMTSFLGINNPFYFGNVTIVAKNKYMS